MAQAAFEETMNLDLDPSDALIVARNDAPWTMLACRNEDLDEDDLNRALTSPTTSVGSSPTAVFSSQELSIVTKPTSYGTGYPIHDYKGQGKVDTAYAASLSATHGSGSEAEADHDDALHTALLGTGAWLSSHQVQDRCLRRTEYARVRLSKKLPHRLKKPPIVLHQFNADVTSACRDTGLRTNAAPTQIEEGPKCLLHRIPRQHYVMFGSIALMALTIFLSSWSIHYTDRAKLASRKRIVFVATMFVALETVITMLVARRTLLEASLLGLFPLITGFMLLLHLDNLI